MQILVGRFRHSDFLEGASRISAYELQLCQRVSNANLQTFPVQFAFTAWFWLFGNHLPNFSNEIRSTPRSRPTRSRRSRTASVMAVVKLSPVSSLICLVRRYASLFFMFMPRGQPSAYSTAPPVLRDGPRSS